MRNCSCRWLSSGPRSKNSAPSTFSYHSVVRSRLLIWILMCWIKVTLDMASPPTTEFVHGWPGVPTTMDSIITHYEGPGIESLWKARRQRPGLLPLASERGHSLQCWARAGVRRCKSQCKVPGAPHPVKTLSRRERERKGEGQWLTPLRGRFFHKVLRMHTFVPQVPPLLSPGSSCRLRQGHGRLTSLVLQRWHRGPGFRHNAALRQRLLAQQGDQQGHPALAKYARQPEASRPARPRVSWAQGRHVEERARGNRRLRSPAYTEQPQGGHSHRQPQPRRPRRIGHARAVPLPARAFGDFEALFDPGAQTIPAGITGLRRQVGQDQPRVFVAVLPAGQQRAGDLVPRKGEAHAAPTRPGPGHEGQQGAPAGRPGGPKAAARVDPQKRMPAQARDAPKQPGRAWRSWG